MKTISQPSVISPSIIVLGVLAAAITFLAWRGTNLPLLSNPKISLAVVLMAGKVFVSVVHSLLDRL